MSTDTNNQQKNTLDDEVIAFAEEAGLVAFESALIRYLAEVEEEEAEVFEKYIETHSEHENFLEDLCDHYPDFEVLLKEEVAELQTELKEIVDLSR